MFERSELSEPLGEKKKRDSASEVGMERSGMSRSQEERIKIKMELAPVRRSRGQKE
jgi:hypothetical protein